MQIRRYFQTWLLNGSLALSLALMACSGLSGPAGGTGGAVGGGNAVGGGDAALSQETAFNPGSVQGGSEGHGQEQKKATNSVSVGAKDGRSNCGQPFAEAQEIFIPQGPVLHASFGSADTGNFASEVDVNLNRFGQGAVPECPLAVPLNDGTNRFMRPGSVRIVVTLTDAAGKAFQSLPRVISCQPTCETKPCEACVDLKELAEIPEADRYVKPVPVDNDNLERIDLGDLPSVEDNDRLAPVLINPDINFGNRIPVFNPNLGH